MQISVERTDSNMNGIKVGDIVNVTNWGGVYSTNLHWFKENFDALDRDWIIRFAFDDASKYSEFGSNSLDETKYKVLFIGKHNMWDKLVALIAEDYDYSPVYLIALDALITKPVPKKMTKAAIEKELGYEIDIVEEENY